MATNAVVKVILQSGGQTIESPEMAREKAEQQLAEIGKIRGSTEELNLPWIQVHGGQILAAHLEERHEPFVG